MSRALQAATLGLIVSLASPLCAAADNNPDSKDTLQELRKALEEEKQRIRQLEQQLAAEEQARGVSAGQQAGTGASPAGGNGSAPGGAAAPGVGTAPGVVPAPAVGSVPGGTAAGGAGAAAGNAGAGGSATAAGSAQPVSKQTGSTPVVTSFGPDGFVLRSVDGANVLKLRGNVTVDGRYFTDSYTPPTADTWIIRRLRPTLEGTLDSRYDFRVMPDFAQGKTILQDAWGSARIEPWLVLTAGKFKAPIGLERLQLEQFARFIEPSLTSDLIPYRDLGFKVGGNIEGGLLTYDVGIFDGAVDAGSTDSNSVPDTNSTGKFTTMGRVFAKPFPTLADGFFSGLGVGFAASYVNNRGVITATSTTSLLASYKTTGQQALFSYRSDSLTGNVNNATIAQGIERRLVPQFSFYNGPVGLLGEYVRIDQDVERQISAATIRNATLRSDAWQIQGYVFLTGEDEAYDKATPKADVGHGGWGAWEIVARYHAINFDDAAFDGGANSFANPASAVRAAHAVGMGLNWYLNRNLKTQIDYEITHFTGGLATGNRPDERVVTSQFALIF
jgi:phosphate-selective porin OprO and OprP